MAFIRSYETVLEYVLNFAMGWTCTFVSVYKIALLLIEFEKDCTAMKLYVFFGDCIARCRCTLHLCNPLLAIYHSSMAIWSNCNNDNFCSFSARIVLF